MKSKIFNSNNLNNIIFIVLLLVIILIVCVKSVQIHNNIIEQFANDEDNSKNDEDIDEALNDVLGSISNNNSDNSENDDADLEEKCKKIESSALGSITSNIVENQLMLKFYLL